MPSHVRVTIVLNAFPKIAADLKPKAERIIAKAAQDIEARAKERAPVDTGRLRTSIKASRVGELHWKVQVGAEYGVYVEHGTRHMRAQPYLMPAVEIVRPGLAEAMRGVAQW
jgi:HK97 gp10 family phage protein